MAGGLIQLITTGIADAPLTNQPEITFFKIVYKQYTHFAIIQNLKNLGNKNFNTINSYKIENNGDLLLITIVKTSNLLDSYIDTTTYLL